MPFVVLKTKSVAIRFQQVVVPWLIAMFGMDYVSEATPDLLRQMIGAIVKKDSEGKHQRPVCHLCVFGRSVSPDRRRGC